MTKLFPYLKLSLISLFISSFAAVSSADTLTLNNGNQIDGKILEINEYDLRIDTQIGFPIYYYYEQIYLVNDLTSDKFKSLFYQDKKDLLRFIQQSTPDGHLSSKPESLQQVPSYGRNSGNIEMDLSRNDSELFFIRI